jgi:hypothetical protein
VAGTIEDQRRAFNRTFRELDARLQLLTSLRIDQLDRLALKHELDAIGRLEAAGGE